MCHIVEGELGAGVGDVEAGVGLGVVEERGGDVQVAQLQERVADDDHPRVLRIAAPAGEDASGNRVEVGGQEGRQLDALDAADAGREAVDIGGAEVQLLDRAAREQVGEADAGAVAVRLVGQVEDGDDADGGRLNSGTLTIIMRPMMFVSMPVPLMFLPIS